MQCAANLGRPDLEVIRANETIMRVVVVFVGRAALGGSPSLPLRRPGAAEGAFRGISPDGAIR